jgi:hypothetical protein
MLINTVLPEISFKKSNLEIYQISSLLACGFSIGHA